MKQRIFLFLGLIILFFTVLSLTLLAGQNGRLNRNEEQLFRSRAELARTENQLREWEERSRLLREEVDVLSGEEKPRIMLTFDDGPSPLTESILDILKEENAPALFFINGANVTAPREDLLKRAVREGHVIGNHTYSHDYDRIYRTVQGFMDDFNRNEELIWKLTGTRSMLVRFPGGSRNSLCAEPEGEKLMADLRDQMDRRGYIYMDWNVTSDAEKPQVLLKSLEEQIYWRRSATLLLHDRADRTVLIEVLPRLIEDLRGAGYEFAVYDPSAGAVRF